MLSLLAVVLATAPIAVPLAPSLETLAAPAAGKVGFVAVDLASGRSVSLNGSDSFPLQSVFKLPVAIEVLRQVDAGALDLSNEVMLRANDRRDGNEFTMKVPAKLTVDALLTAMLINSDNIACDKLLAMVGGAKVVNTRMKALNIEGISIHSSERDLGRGKPDNTGTPAALVNLLARMASHQVGLSEASASHLEELLVGVKTGPNRMKGALPPGTPVAHKTGMSGTARGITDATNDVGLVTLPDGRRIAVAAFVHCSPADLETRDRVIAKMTRAAYDVFSGP
jgi:beta-lactamase class A